MPELRALHIEANSSKIRVLKNRLAHFCGTMSTTFPDGTILHLISLFSSIISACAKGNMTAKFTQCLANGSFWELSTDPHFG